MVAGTLSDIQFPTPIHFRRMKKLTINYLAVGVCFVLLTAIGFVWYGPLFGEVWMKMVGLDPDEVAANPPGAGIWLTNIIATIFPLVVLAWLFVQLNVESFVRGAVVGLIIAFSFVFLSKMTGNLFAQAPYALTWIEGGFDLVALTLSGAILGGWRKYVG